MLTFWNFAIKWKKSTFIVDGSNCFGAEHALIKKKKPKTTVLKRFPAVDCGGLSPHPPNHPVFFLIFFLSPRVFCSFYLSPFGIGIFVDSIKKYPPLSSLRFTRERPFLNVFFIFRIPQSCFLYTSCFFLITRNNNQNTYLETCSTDYDYRVIVVSLPSYDCIY